MRVLVVTNMYPTRELPAFGVFVQDQVLALRRAGVTVDVFFVNGQASSWNYLFGVIRFWRFLWGRHYDVIHAHYVLAGVIARAQWRYPVVLTHHGCEVLGFPRWQTWLAHLVTPLFDQVVYTGEHLRRALRDVDGWVVPCGIDLDLFVPLSRAESRARLGLPADRPLVLWAGIPERPEKRFDLVEAAMEYVTAQLPEARLVVARSEPHEVIPLYMNACDVLVLTSAAEGSPMVVKEAMACCLPVVSVRVGDVAEVIQGTLGCALAEADPAALASRLVEVLREPRRTDGRAHVEHLRHERIADMLVAIYARAVGPRPNSYVRLRVF